MPESIQKTLTLTEPLAIFVMKNLTSEVCKSSPLASKHCCDKREKHLEIKTDLVSFVASGGVHDARRSNLHRALVEVHGMPGTSVFLNHHTFNMPRGRNTYQETKAAVNDWQKNEYHFKKSGIGETTTDLVSNVMKSETSRNSLQQLVQENDI